MSFYNNTCKLDSTNYYNWLRLYHVYQNINKDPQTQLRVLDKVQELKPDATFVYMSKGWNYFQIKDYEKTILNYKKAIQLNPKYSNGYRIIGLSYSELGDSENAMKNYNKAIEIDSTNTWAYISRGDEFNKKQNYDKALKDLNRAMNLGLVKTNVYYSRGSVYHNLKQYQKALSDYNKAIGLDPSYHYAYNGIGNVYSAMKEGNEALPFYNRAIELDPNEPIYYRNRALAYRQLSQLEEALLDYNKAIEVDSTYDMPYNDIGNVYYYDRKDAHKALPFYNKAIELNPNEPIYYRNRASAYQKISQFEEALSDYNKAIEIDSTSAITYNNRGLIYYDMKDYKKALLDYNKAIELNPKSTLYIKNRRLVDQKLGNTDKTQKENEKTKELKPETVKIDLRDPSQLFLDGKTLEGLKLINEKWITAHPDKTEDVSFLKPYLQNQTSQELISKVNSILKDSNPAKKETKKLPFYKNIFLHKLKNIVSKNNEDIYMYVITDASMNIRMILNGSSSPIHRMNDEFPINLTNENVSEYLKFFCAHVHDQGAFQIISTIDDFKGVENNNSEKLEKIKKRVENVINETNTEINFIEESWYTERIIFYAGSLFKAKFKVSQEGNIEMLEDKPLNIKIPAKALFAIGSFYQFKEINAN